MAASVDISDCTDMQPSIHNAASQVGSSRILPCTDGCRFALMGSQASARCSHSSYSLQRSRLTCRLCAEALTQKHTGQLSAGIGCRHDECGWCCNDSWLLARQRDSPLQYCRCTSAWWTSRSSAALPCLHLSSSCPPALINSGLPHTERHLAVRMSPSLQ